jgi:hypothetical protein
MEPRIRPSDSLGSLMAVLLVDGEHCSDAAQEAKFTFRLRSPTKCEDGRTVGSVAVVIPCQSNNTTQLLTRLDTVSRKCEIPNLLPQHGLRSAVPLKPPEMQLRPPPPELPRASYVGIVRAVQKPRFSCRVCCWGDSGANSDLTTNTKMNRINGLILTQLPAPSVYRPPYSSTAVSPLDAALCEPARRIAARRQLGGTESMFHFSLGVILSDGYGKR